MNTYRCDFIVEEFIDGREFTVGLLGNREETRVLRPMELVFCRHTEGNYNVYGYHVKCNYKDYIDYVCPARITPEQEKKLAEAALAVYNALGCRDFSRVDFRFDRHGEVYFLEINPLPGLAPGYSDFPMLAEASGIPYDDLIISILGAARKRLGPYSGVSGK
jgi:D-alanine-D-alanine ligase